MIMKEQHMQMYFTGKNCWGSCKTWCSSEFVWMLDVMAMGKRAVWPTLSVLRYITPDFAQKYREDNVVGRCHRLLEALLQQHTVTTLKMDTHLHG